MKKLFKKQPIVSWIMISAAVVLLIFSTAVQIAYMDSGIVLPLVKLFVPLVLLFGILFLLKKRRITRFLHENSAKIVIGGLCSVILITIYIETGMFCASPYPLYTVCAVFIFAATALATTNRVFAGGCILWLEATVLCLFAGLANCFEAVFTISILGAVSGVILCLRSDKKVLSKIYYMIYVFALTSVCLAITFCYCDDIVAYVVDRAYPLNFWYVDDRLPSLSQFCFVGASKTKDPFGNVLAVGTGHLGTVFLIGIAVLMLTIIVCSLILLKQKKGMALYLHVGAMVCIILSFLGNLLYLCGIGNMVTLNATFINTNLCSLICEALLLVCILRHEPFLMYRQSKGELLQGFFPKVDQGYDYAIQPLAVAPYREFLVDFFSPKESDILGENGNIATVLEGVEQCYLFRYEGPISSISDVLKHIKISADQCFVRVYTGIHTSLEEHCGILEDLHEYLPEKYTTCVQMDAYEEGECSLYILSA